MRRTMYESDGDRQKEKEIIEKVLAARGSMIAKKNPCPPYKIDWSILRSDGTLWAFCEVKARKNKYPTYRLGFHKYQTLCEASKTLKSILMIEWPDGIYVADIGQTPIKGVVWMEDKRRRDDTDMEPAIEIEMHHFKRIVEYATT